jgi:hypothetical protein
MGELQMDWLRSEDLKEGKNVAASVDIIAVERPLRSLVAGSTREHQGRSRRQRHRWGLPGCSVDG